MLHKKWQHQLLWQPWWDVHFPTRCIKNLGSTSQYNVDTIFHSFDTAKILLAYLGKDHQYMSIHHDLILYKRPRRTKARDCYSFAVGDGHNLDYKMTTGSRSTNFRPWLKWENGFNLDTWRKRRREKWVLFTNFSINATTIRDKNPRSKRGLATF